MIQRIALAVALSAVPLCAGHATRAYDNWFVTEILDGRCLLSDTTYSSTHDKGQLTVKFIVRLDKGIPQLVTVDLEPGVNSILKIGSLTFSIDGHTFKALHPDVEFHAMSIEGNAELPVEIFNAMRIGKTLRYEYRVAGEEKPFVHELSLEGFDDAVASCRASTEKQP